MSNYDDTQMSRLDWVKARLVLYGLVAILVGLSVYTFATGQWVFGVLAGVTAACGIVACAVMEVRLRRLRRSPQS